MSTTTKWRPRMLVTVSRVVALGSAACVSNGVLFSAGPRPGALAGVWVDVRRTTPSDTVAWVLAANGEERTLRIHVATDAVGHVVVTRREQRNGSWYLSGAMSDPARRALCYRRRSRDGGTCVQFELDTMTVGGVAVRQLTVHAPRGESFPPERVLLERMP